MEQHYQFWPRAGIKTNICSFNPSPGGVLLVHLSFFSCFSLLADNSEGLKLDNY